MPKNIQKRMILDNTIKLNCGTLFSLKHELLSTKNIGIKALIVPDMKDLFFVLNENRKTKNLEELKRIPGFSAVE
jgi:hypothetical protein